MASEKYQVERDYMAEAFEIYYDLGEDRSYAKVAEIIDKSPSTVKEWGRAFDWVERVQERKAEIDERVSEAKIEREVEDRLNARESLIEAVRQGAAAFRREVESGRREVDAEDLERLANIYQRLTGGATERLEINDGRLLEQARSDEGFRKLLLELDDRLEGDGYPSDETGQA